jgi:hypothetical protein
MASIEVVSIPTGLSGIVDKSPNLTSLPKGIEAPK